MSNFDDVKVMHESNETNSIGSTDSESKNITIENNQLDGHVNSITSNIDYRLDDSSERLEIIKFVDANTSNCPLPSVRVFDVAAYILEKLGSMTTMKLQKLVYYCQAWSLVWDEKPLFEEKIEAWANGPVVRKLFDYHRGSYELSSIPIGNSRLLNQVERDTIDVVLDYYGDRSSQWLIDLTHHEDPWKHARKGLPPLERSNRVISLDSMADFYSSLQEKNEIGKWQRRIGRFVKHIIQRNRKK